MNLTGHAPLPPGNDLTRLAEQIHRLDAKLDSVAGMQARLERLLDAIAGTLGITASEAGHLMLPPVPGTQDDAGPCRRYPGCGCRNECAEG